MFLATDSGPASGNKGVPKGIDGKTTVNNSSAH